jgi:hypothetical protein
LGVGLAFFGLYGATAAPTIVELFDDSLEFQLVAPTWGIAHPTGYPLYILLGGLWSRLLFPFGNWAWRMNLFSALAAAVSMGLLFWLASQLTPARPAGSQLWAGLAAALAYGLGPIWWSQATVAEVYTLHALFVIALLSLTLHLFPPDPLTPSPPHHVPWSSCLPLSLLLGLALTHHRTTLLLLPALLIYLLWRVPGLWRPRRLWVQWAGALLAPLLLYLFLPVRAALGGQDLHGSYINTWAGFWDHILARQYTGFFGENPLAVQRTWLGWFQVWREQMGWPALLLGLVGGWWLWQAGRATSPVWFLLLLTMLTNGLFALLYQTHDAQVFLLPALLVFALFTGAGVGWIGHTLSRWSRWTQGGQLFAVVLLLIGGGRGAAVNRNQVWTVHDYAIALAKIDFPSNSHVVGLEGEMTALRYMQQAEGLGLPATAVVADDPVRRRQIVEELVQAGHPTYLTRELNNLAQGYSFSGEGPLVRVWPRGQAQVGPPSIPLQVQLVNGQLTLEGYDLVKLEQAGGPALRMAFYWRPQSVLTPTLKLSLRLQLLDGTAVRWPDGQPVQEDHFPLRMVAMTPTWLPGELVRDVHYLPIPASVVGQPARLHVVLYDAEIIAEVGVWQVDLTW